MTTILRFQKQNDNIFKFLWTTFVENLLSYGSFLNWEFFSNKTQENAFNKLYLQSVKSAFNFRKSSNTNTILNSLMLPTAKQLILIKLLNVIKRCENHYINQDEKLIELLNYTKTQVVTTLNLEVDPLSLTTKDLKKHCIRKNILDTHNNTPENFPLHSWITFD